MIRQCYSVECESMYIFKKKNLFRVTVPSELYFSAVVRCLSGYDCWTSCPLREEKDSLLC